MQVIIFMSSLVVTGGTIAHQTSHSPQPNLGLVMQLSSPTVPGLAKANPTRSTNPTPAATPTQWSGQYGGSTDYATDVAVDQNGWERLWRRVNRNPPTRLNLAAHMAVMVHLGERHTGGYTIRVTRAYIEDRRFVIECAEVAPSPERYVTQAFTQPWVIAVVPSSKLPVIFKTLLANVAKIDE